ncbi:MAG: hypothetical protein ABI411_14280 [Tahibacter sp.]
MRILAILLMLLCAAPAGAQCQGSTFSGPVAFPTQLSFEPAQPLAGQAVTALLGPAIEEDVSYDMVRVGNIVNVTGSLRLFDGLPPPPHINELALSSFPPGSYTVNLQLTYNAAICTPISGSFVVGGGNAMSAPTLGWPMLVALSGYLLAIAALRIRRRGRAGNPVV